MSTFFKTILVFIYFCLTFFIKPSETFAFISINNLTDYNIAAESVLSLFNGTEEYYAVIQSNNNIQIVNNNKDNTFGYNTNGDIAAVSNFIKYYSYVEKIIDFQNININKSKLLKNSISTRAP